MASIRLFFLAACAIGASGCVTQRSAHGYALERGETELTARNGLDTKESVLAKYGEPSVIGTFNPNSWYYVSALDASRAFFRPDTTNRTVVAFKFDGGGVVESVTTYNLADGADIDMLKKETPTRGRELGFWEQLLGNVGRLPTDTGNPGGGPPSN